MHILNDGREAFLGFLRNLTPQIAILTVAFLAGAQLERAAQSGTVTGMQLIIFVVLIVIWVLAVAANTMSFVMDFVSAFGDTGSGKASESGLHSIRFAFRHKKLQLLEGIFIAVVAQVAPAIAFVVAAHNSNLFKF